MGKAGKVIMVLMESLSGSGHKLIKTRPKIGDKLEIFNFDPYVRKVVLYREKRKVRTLR